MVIEGVTGERRDNGTEVELRQEVLISKKKKKLIVSEQRLFTLHWFDCVCVCACVYVHANFKQLIQ